MGNTNQQKELFLMFFFGAKHWIRDSMPFNHIQLWNYKI